MIGAGTVGGSLIGQLPGRARELGPVAGISYRVASRIANALRAGYAVRTVEELNDSPAVLFYAPPEQMVELVELLAAADIRWRGKSLIFCDCKAEQPGVEGLRAKGASVATAMQIPVAGRIATGGDGPAIRVVHRMAGELGIKALELREGATDLFDAAVTLATIATTPLLDRAASLLRDAGVRDPEAARLAAAMFEYTARDYAHSGKQSWGWHARKPEAKEIDRQLAAVAPETRALLRGLLLFGTGVFGKHREMAERFRAQDDASDNAKF